MPYYFTCPSCKKPNYGYKDAPKGLSYFPGLQCARCGVKGIAWVEHDRISIDEPRHMWAVGVGQSDIAYLNPEAATDSADMAMQKLKSVATFVAAYNQGARGEAFTPNNKEVGEGQCAGQCLHWIRRVLQGGREGYLAPTRKGTKTRSDQELSDKYKVQHLGGAVAQIVLGRTKDTAPAEKIAEINQKVTKLLLDKGFNKTATGWEWSGETDEEEQQKTEFYYKVQAKRKELVDKVNSEGVYAYAWDDMARQLDQALARYGKKKTFSGIVALRCVNRSQNNIYKDGTSSAFAGGIVGDSDFQVGRAAILSVGLRIGIGEKGGKITGHAIAVHYAAPNAQYLFDPNLGTYKTTSPSAMKTALATLMGPVWQSMGWQLDGSFGFAFFKAKEELPTYRTPEKEVNYSSTTPIVTAIQNQSIGTLPTVTSGSSGEKPKPVVKQEPQKAQVYAPQSPPKIAASTTAKTGGPGKLNPALLKMFNQG
jgi:hypothetical protein